MVEHRSWLVYLCSAPRRGRHFVIEPLARPLAGDEVPHPLARASRMPHRRRHLGRICLAPASNPGIYGIACLASVTAASMPASRACSWPRRRRGRRAALGFGRPRVRVGTRRAGLARLLVRYGAPTRARPARSTHGRDGGVGLRRPVVRPPEPRRWRRLLVARRRGGRRMEVVTGRWCDFRSGWAAHLTPDTDITVARIGTFPASDFLPYLSLWTPSIGGFSMR